jgi:hypothetical protein
MFNMLLPWIVAALEVLIILPLILYITSKLLKIENENIKFFNCVWTVFIAGLLGGLAGDYNIWLGLALFIILLGIMTKTQFKTNLLQLIIILIITGGVALGLEYTKPYIYKYTTLPSTKDEEVSKNKAQEVKTENTEGNSKNKNIYCEYNIATNWLKEVNMEESLVDKNNLAPFKIWGEIAANHIFNKYGINLNSYSEISNEGDDKNWFTLDLKTCTEDYEKLTKDLNELYGKFKTDNPQFFK